ncbi:MAG: type II toxin-antitoxin system PemK/MazF family toxin [Oscillatoria sp. PMC 1051.18]|nr:type II toxin-antitoxin system PemK/MazF family toxin [Oscillatoria sp. PMC 1050.18]MEC5032691.1 type II toxin-antitoxin system PemK/MazF family toxin [Oscillatoria sp. PMC 1051.18]
MPNYLTVRDVVIVIFPQQNPQGREQVGYRPAIVVGVSDRVATPRFDLIVVVPLTSDRGQTWAQSSPELYPHLVAGVAGLPRNSLVLLDQIRAIDLNRVVRYLGTLTSEQYSLIRDPLQIMLDL